MMAALYPYSEHKNRVKHIIVSPNKVRKKGTRTGRCGPFMRKKSHYPTSKEPKYYQDHTHKIFWYFLPKRMLLRDGICFGRVSQACSTLYQQKEQSPNGHLSIAIFPSLM
jgi:hypothetical protein